MRKAVAAKYGSQTVALAGVFLIEKGQAKIHVMVRECVFLSPSPVLSLTLSLLSLSLRHTLTHSLHMLNPVLVLALQTTGNFFANNYIYKMLQHLLCHLTD